MTDDEAINQIVDILDPLCRRRYKEGECLPRGEETTPLKKVNEVQEWRERTARAKAKRILKIFRP